MRYEIKQYSEIEKNKWDNFVYSNSMGWAYFLYDVIAIDRFIEYKNLSFAIVDNDNKDEIVMVMQLHEIDNRTLWDKFRLKKIKLTSRWGYILKDELTKKQFRLIKTVFENYIDNYIITHNIKDFEISLPPLSEFMLKQGKINPLIFMNFEPNIRYTSIVDLSKSDDRILADCEETTRQAIRKIEKANQYSIIEANSSEEDLKKYISLHKETYTRTGAIKNIIDNKYHENIFFNLIPQKICRVFFLKDNSTNEKVAAVAIIVFKNTAYYWWGCSKTEKSIGINKYLLFNVIKLIREDFHKIGYFETGGTYPYLRTGKYKGLSDFKKCFGTFLYPIYMGNYKKINKSKKSVGVERVILLRDFNLKVA